MLSPKTWHSNGVKTFQPVLLFIYTRALVVELFCFSSKPGAWGWQAEGTWWCIPESLKICWLILLLNSLPKEINERKSSDYLGIVYISWLCEWYSYDVSDCKNYKGVCNQSMHCTVNSSTCVSSLWTYTPWYEIMMSGHPYCVVSLKSAMPTCSPDLVLRDELESLFKVIDDSQDVSVPFSCHQSANQIYPDVAVDFVGDVHCLGVGVYLALWH